MKWLFILLMTASLKAATFTASSCYFIDVSNACVSASAGDTVLIPAGDCVWTNMPLQGLLPGASRTLTGAGIGQTIIRDGSSVANHQLITPTSGRISGFTISAGTNCNAVIKFASVTVSNACVRIDHLEITNLIERGIQMLGWNVSVIDHCKFVIHPTLGAPTGIDVTGYGNLSISQFGGATNSNQSWDTIPYQSGTTNMVVIEDCTFDWQTSSSGANGAIDAYNGARFTFRRNFMRNVNVGAHGTDSGGAIRSTHSWECYGNIFSNTVSVLPFSFRGGTGVIYSNQLWQSGAGQNAIRIDNYRSSGTNIYGGSVACCAPYEGHSATNIWAGKEDAATGWPSYDQIGRTSPTFYTATNTVQTLRPLYQWSNTYNGVIGMGIGNGTAFENVSPYDYIPNSTNIIKLDRDYFNNTLAPDYSALVYPHPLVTLQDSQTVPVPPSSALSGNAVIRGNAILR